MLLVSLRFHFIYAQHKLGTHKPSFGEMFWSWLLFVLGGGRTGRRSLLSHQRPKWHFRLWLWHDPAVARQASLPLTQPWHGRHCSL